MSKGIKLFAKRDSKGRFKDIQAYKCAHAKDIKDMTDKFILRDSGQRERFASGMVRDTQVGKGRFDLISPFALFRLARIYEKGSVKYEDRNWEKGAKFGRFISSTLRHIAQYMMGMKDEDHLAQATWNLFAIMHLEKTHPELDNMPHYLKEDIKEEKDE